MNPRAFLLDERGTAASEFALILPLLILLLFGGSEAGHFVWTQHKLTEGVRNGVRYASRLPIDQVCNGATTVLADPALANIKLITRTGQVATAGAKATVPGWTAGQVSVTVSCQAFVSTGIYSDLNGAGPIVTVSATNVAYPTLFKMLGNLPGSIHLNAKASTAVIGI
ncbi:MAG: TadE/TadG family type IV pilus assembly protein [Novosphingobium sp.]